MRTRLFLALVLLFFSGCMVSRGVVHTVGRGETFWRICTAYKVDPQEVAEINNIKDPENIKAGRKIFIPGARRVIKVGAASAGEQPEPATVAPGASSGPREKKKEPRIVIEKDRFSWPVKGEIISPFGMRDGLRHEGIDIKSAEGTPVKAAAEGKVVYSSSGIRGYGNIIIIHHKDDFYTVYAHNKENVVKQGASVAKGEVIATVGKTGNAAGYQLHFEVRQGKNVRNPLFFLP